MSVRHVIHDNDRCRLVVEVDVGLVTITLWWGLNTGSVGQPSMASHGTMSLSPAAARDRGTLRATIEGLERIVGLSPRSGSDDSPTRIGSGELFARRVPLDVIHRSVLDVTRRPTA